MKLLVSSILILLALTAFAQDEQLLTLKDFRGLNTKLSDFAVAPNESRIAHEIDWGRNLGSITKRFGYDLYGSFGGAGAANASDSIVGIYGAYFPNGTQRLFVVTDSATVGYGCVWVTPDNNALTFANIDTICFQVGPTETRVMSIILGSDTANKTYTAGEGFLATLDSLVDTCSAVLTNLTTVDTSAARATFGGCGESASDSACVTIVLTYTLNEGGVPALAELDASKNITSCVKTRHYATTNSWDLVTTQFSIQEKPSFAVNGGSVYITNGRQGGGIWDEVNGYKAWPPPAPGSFEAIPIHDATKNLHGEYYYVVSAWAYKGATPDSFNYQPGYVVGPVSVDSGAVLLTGLMQAAQDSLTESYDSLAFDIFRTKTGDELRDTTAFWSLSGNTEYEFKWSDTTGTPLLSSLTFTDTLHDSDLVSPTVLYDAISGQRGRDSVGALTRRYGSPGYDSTAADNNMDTVNVNIYTPTRDTAGHNGIFYGIVTQTDTIGVVYVSTFMDTINAIESDTGRSILVRNTFSGGASLPRYGNRIELPAPPDDDSGLVRNLYRSHLQVLLQDSLYRVGDSVWLVPDTFWYVSAINQDQVDVVSTTDFDGSGNIAWIRPAYWLNTRPLEWVKKRVIDTVLADWFRLVAQVSTDSSSYLDTIRYDGIVNAEIFNRAPPPHNMSNIFTFDGRLFGQGEGRYWFSNLFNSTNKFWEWGQISFLDIDPGGGDNATAAFPSRTNLRVLKNESNYVIPLPQSGGFGRAQLAGNFGCIAPRSVAHGFGGHYYLTSYGVVRETEGLLLENTYLIDTISGVLDNLEKLSTSIKREAVGFYDDQRYMLSIPSLDTTYVYDERSKNWATWGFSFGGGTHYGVDLYAQRTPGDTMYFFKQGGNDIYRYGTSELDNGAAVSIRWKSGPLLMGPNEKQITKMGLWVNSADFTSNRFFIRLNNEEGTSLDSVYYTTLNSKRYHLNGADPTSAISYTVEAMTINQTLDSTIIDAIDIFWKPVSGQTKQY